MGLNPGLLQIFGGVRRSNLSDRSHPQLSLSRQFLAACLQRKFKYKVSAFFFLTLIKSENPKALFLKRVLAFR
jgi:hypothetical protein